LTDVPADGSKWEIIEGTLIVNPAPRPRHQQAVFQLGRLLADVCPPDLQVFISPIDWTIPDGGVVQPDLVVVRRSDVDLDEALSMPPVLVVEVLSPSNAAQDRLLKRDLYERLGVPSYWLVEPTEPGITALELDEATAKYVEVATVTGDRIFAVSAPYAVEFPASALA
jgi:Uma2 family endonuclease